MKKNNLIYYIATFLVFFFVLTFDVLAYCPLGPDVTKDLYNVLKVMKILAPLLCVVLSTYDAIRAVTKGDPATDMKAVAKKFGKRMIYTILLFFIPVLIDICFQMADVWDANGTCNLEHPEPNEPNSPELEDFPGPSELEYKCWSKGTMEECVETEGCDWVAYGLLVEGILDANYNYKNITNDAPKYIYVKKCDAAMINNTVCNATDSKDVCLSKGYYQRQSACKYKSVSSQEQEILGYSGICYRNPEYIRVYRQPWQDKYNETGSY